MEDRLDEINRTLIDLRAFLEKQFGGSTEACTKPWTEHKEGEEFPKLPPTATVKDTLCYISCASREMLEVTVAEKELVGK